MKGIFRFAAVLLGAAALTGSIAHAQKTLFYMTEDPGSERDFLAHANQVDTLSPAWYSTNAQGLLRGNADPVILKAAHDAHDTVIALVGLADKEDAHQLFQDQRAQDALNQAMIRECRQHGYAGFQLDIEDILWTDKDALSAMVARSADALHAAHLQLQIAVVPGAPGYPGSTAFGTWMYEDWRGAYDIAALAKSVDLLCLMTYDQHTRWTTPGPVGGWKWTIENMKYALARMPADKLSLGIALYGYHWYAGDPGLGQKEQKPNPTADYIGYEDAEMLRKSYGGVSQWDPVDHSNWFYFYRDQTREWVFDTNKRSFEDRYNLAKENHLQGICAWVLGQEDPAIWTILPKHS
jgi:spore germination protein YaaH